MEIHELLRVLSRRWWVICVTVCLGLIIAAGASVAAVPTFTTSTRVYLTARTSGTAFSLWVSGAFLRREIGTYEDLATDSVVLQPVVDELRLPGSVDELASRVTVTASPLEPGVFDIQVTDSDGPRAAATANEIVRNLRAVTERLSTNAQSDGAIVTITQTRAARAPSHPEFPRTSVDLGVGMLGGLLAGLVLGTSLERLDSRLRRAEDVAELTDVAVFAMPVRRAVRSAAPHEAEVVRRLAESLRYVADDVPGRVFVVAPADSSAVGTRIAPDLAAAATSTLTGASSRVVVVDCDLRSARRPAGSDGPAAGLAGVLAGRLPLDGAIRPSSEDRIDLLPAGGPAPNSVELLQSPRMRTVVDELRERYEIVIIAAPPLLPLADTALLAPLASGTVLVCTYGSTRRERLLEALERVLTSGGDVVGVVLSTEAPADRQAPGDDDHLVRSASMATAEVR